MADDDGNSRIIIILVLVAFLVILAFFVFFFILRRSQPIGGKCTGSSDCDPGLTCTSGTCKVPLGAECTSVLDCESSAQECRSLKAGVPATCNYATGSLGDPCGNQIGNSSCVSAFTCDFATSSSVPKSPTFTCVIPDCKTGCEGNDNWCLVTSTCSATGQCTPIGGTCPSPLPIPTPIPLTTHLTTPLAFENKGYLRLPINDRLLYDGQYIDATNEGLKLNGRVVLQKVFTQIFTFDGYLYGVMQGKIYKIDYGNWRTTSIFLPSLLEGKVVYVSSTLDDNEVWVQSTTDGILFSSFPSTKGRGEWKISSKERIRPGTWRIYGKNHKFYQELNGGQYESIVGVDSMGKLWYPKGNERIRIQGNEATHF